jgi:predicted RNA-binding protein YlqC (UPF0109 family)
MSTAAEDLVSVVRLLVDDPKAVTVESVELPGPPGEPAEIELRVGVDPADRGKVIGRRGRTIDALRALADARGERDGRRYAVEIDE